MTLPVPVIAPSQMKLMQIAAPVGRLIETRMGRPNPLDRLPVAPAAGGAAGDRRRSGKLICNRLHFSVLQAALRKRKPLRRLGRSAGGVALLHEDVFKGERVAAPLHACAAVLPM